MVLGVRSAFCMILVVTFSCQRNDALEDYDFPQLMEVPKGFPSIDFPTDNAFSMERWQLGKKLFYEKALSIDSSISCASCHQQSLGFADQLPVSKGAGGLDGRRNAPTLTNVAYQPYYTKEGGIPTLEMQVLIPIQEHDEFNFNLALIVDRLSQDTTYLAMAQRAYHRPLDHYVITRALGNFERSLLSGWSPYDRYTQNSDYGALSILEKKGMQLFFSERTGCASCHDGFNFTSYALENNGLYEEYQDPGRYRLTGNPEDVGRFKVPTLRNIGLTAPYMHDGSLSSLSAVIEHYNSGGNDHPNKSPLIRPLGLSQWEKEALKAFLKNGLTDHLFVENPIFENEN